MGCGRLPPGRDGAGRGCPTDRGRKGPLAGPGRDGCDGDGMRSGEGDWRMGGGLRGGGEVMVERGSYKRRVYTTLVWSLGGETDALNPTGCLVRKYSGESD